MLSLTFDNSELSENCHLIAYLCCSGTRTDSEKVVFTYSSVVWKDLITSTPPDHSEPKFSLSVCFVCDCCYITYFFI